MRFVYVNNTPQHCYPYEISLKIKTLAALPQILMPALMVSNFAKAKSACVVRAFSRYLKAGSKL
jgi:hypothetical protein